jgi:hypothetical protein
LVGEDKQFIHESISLIAPDAIDVVSKKIVKIKQASLSQTDQNQQQISLIHYSSPTSLIFTVCGQVSHNLGQKTLTVDKSNIISVVHTVMGSIETVHMTKELKGQQKKDLAIDCLNWFVDQQEHLSYEEKSVIHDSIALIVPDAIDVIAEIGNGVSDLVKNGVSSLVSTKMCCTIS